MTRFLLAALLLLLASLAHAQNPVTIAGPDPLPVSMVSGSHTTTGTVNGLVDFTIATGDMQSVTVYFNSTTFNGTEQLQVLINGVYTSAYVLEITDNSLAIVGPTPNIMFTGGASIRTLLVVLPPGATSVKAHVSAFTAGTMDVTLIATAWSHNTTALMVGRDATHGVAGFSVLGNSAGNIPAAPTVSASGGYSAFTDGFVTHVGSGTVTANAGTNLNTSALALDATLTGGTQQAIARGGAKGATAAATVTSTAQGADHQAFDVQTYFAGTAVDPRSIRALTSGDTVTAVQATGTNLHIVCDSGCTPGGSFTDNSAFTFGTTAINNAGYVVDDVGTNAVAENSSGAPRMTGNRVAYADLSLTGANATAIKVDGSTVTQPVSGTFFQATQPVSAAALPLPAGASTLAEQQTQTTSLQLIDNIVSGTGANISQMNGTTVTMNAGVANAGTQRVTVATDDTVTVNGIVAITGPDPVDAPVTGNPIRVGGRASTATPGAVSADGDAQNVWLTRNGAVQVALGTGGAITGASTSGVVGEAAVTGLNTRAFNYAFNGGTSLWDAVFISTADPVAGDRGVITRNIPSGTQASSLTDTVNGTVAVKAASTAAVAADKALVVAVSPNNTIQTSIPDVSSSQAISTTTCTAGVANQTGCVIVAAAGRSGWMVTWPTASTFVGVLVAEASNDGTGTTWTPTFFDAPSTSTKAATVAPASGVAGAFSLIPVGGATYYRVRASTATSGTGTLTLTSVAGQDPSMLSAGPNNAAAPPTAMMVGGESIAQGTQPTAATAGNMRRALLTTEGVQFVQEGNSNRFSCFVPLTATVTTQCQAAPAAGLRAYVTSVTLTNGVITAQTLDVVYGTGAACVTGITALTHKFAWVGATESGNQNASASYPTPLVPVAANAICVRPSAATAFGATITGYIAP